LAAARALATPVAPGIAPDERFIDPLSRLLGANADLTAAAAQALAVFKGNAIVRERLNQFALNLTQLTSSRVAVIRGMGRLVDKQTAANLVRLLDQDNARIRDAAAEALAEMTGFAQLGRDVQSWRAWWRDNQNKSDADWASELLTRATGQKADLDRRMQLNREKLYDLLRTEYQRPDADKPKILLENLRHDSEDVRLETVRIVLDEVV